VVVFSEIDDYEWREGKYFELDGFIVSQDLFERSPVDTKKDNGKRTRQKSQVGWLPGPE
jgi:hypothetical protein